MAFDLAIADNGDLIVAGNRDLQGVSGAELIAQRVRLRLKIMRGSWIYDDDGTLGSQLHSTIGHMHHDDGLETMFQAHVREALRPMDDVQISDIRVEHTESILVEKKTTVNMIRNPSFERSLAGVYVGGDGSTLQRIVGAGLFGSDAAKITTVIAGGGNAGVIGPGLAISPGKVYTASYYAKAAPGHGGVKVDVQVNATDITLANLIEYIHGGEQALSETEWKRLSHTFTAPPGSAVGGLYFTLGDTQGASNAQWFIDGLQFEEASKASDYLDGDQPGGAWDGTPHNSTSSRVTEERQAANSVTISVDVVPVLEDDIEQAANAVTVSVPFTIGGGE